MIDILSILIAGIFSCIILDILGYLLKKIGIPDQLYESSKAEIKSAEHISTHADIIAKISGKELSKYSYKNEAIIKLVYNIKK